MSGNNDEASLRVYTGDERLEETTVHMMFEVEKADRYSGGIIQWDSPILLRHVESARYLCTLLDGALYFSLKPTSPVAVFRPP